MTDVSRETIDRMAAYAALLRKWNSKINLVAPATLDDLEDRHLADCQQLADLAQPLTGRWADLGSGGGLPGIVMAMASQPGNAHWTLVESDQRKAAFLRSAIRELDLARTTVATERIETLPPLNADAITARALAPLSRLVPYLVRHLAPGGTGWLMKGRRWRDEIAELEGTDHARSFTITPFDSRTEPGAAILRLNET